MKLESAVKYFNLKSPCVDAAAQTTGDSLTGSDLMAAIGFCQSKSRFGLAAFLAKAGISDDDRQRAIGYLLSYAHRTAPKLVVKAAGGKLHKCLAVLSTLAFEEYSRSAVTVSECQHCYGVGFVSVWRDVVKYPGYINKQTGEMVIEPRTEHRCVREKCAHCGGKGRIVARCRCNGTGRVRDVEKSALQGVPIDRECERCNVGGSGGRREQGRTGLYIHCYQSYRNAPGITIGAHFLIGWWKNAGMRKPALILRSGKQHHNTFHKIAFCGMVAVRVHYYPVFSEELRE